jgi:hypothetical protein
MVGPNPIAALGIDLLVDGLADRQLAGNDPGPEDVELPKRF